MRFILRKLIVPASFILVTACGGSGGDDPVVDPNPVDPNPVEETGNISEQEVVTEPNNAVTSIDFFWPADFSVIDGEERITFAFDTYEYQRGRIIASSDDTVRCTDGFELAEEVLDVDTINAQIVSSYGGQVISVDDISTDVYRGQEVILSDIFDSNADITTIARHYYLSSDRLNANPGDSAVFYLRCNTSTNNYAQNEGIMRSVLESVEFTFSP